MNDSIWGSFATISNCFRVARPPRAQSCTNSEAVEQISRSTESLQRRRKTEDIVVGLLGYRKHLMKPTRVPATYRRGLELVASQTRRTIMKT